MLGHSFNDFHALPDLTNIVIPQHRFLSEKLLHVELLHLEVGGQISWRQSPVLPSKPSAISLQRRQSSKCNLHPSIFPLNSIIERESFPLEVPVR